MTTTAIDPKEVEAHWRHIDGIIATTALITSLAMYAQPHENRGAIAQALTTADVFKSRRFLTEPALRALADGIPILGQTVAFSEMAGVGFVYEQARLFCTSHGILESRLFKLPWSDLAWVLRTTFFHNGRVQWRKGAPDTIHWRSLKWDRSKVEGNLIERGSMISQEEIFQLMIDIMESARVEYLR